MTGILQLGRWGDILNILPLAHHLNQQGERSTLIVAEEFAGIAESISYADVLPFAGSSLEVRRAHDWAAPQFGRLLFSQVYRPDMPAPRATGETFCETSYDFAGYGDLFRMGAFDRILLDRRNREREEKLVDRTFQQKGGKKILVNMGGFSSPFIFRREIMQAIQRRIGRFAELVDLSAVRAQNFCDLLGLYEQADLLVTTDTGTLHLAGATSLPYIAFIADRPSRWHGAYTRGECIMRTRYADALDAVSVMDRLLYFTLHPPERDPKLHHVYYEFPTTRPDTIRRNRNARQTWRTAYRLGNWIPTPVRDDCLQRSFADGGRSLRFIKDVFDRGLQNLADEDWVVFTNTDTCLSPALTQNLIALAKRGQMMVGQRMDLPRLDEQLLTRRQVAAGRPYCGTDLFFFPARYWRKVGHDFPDMLLGAEAWDYVLRELMLKHGAACTTDLIYHERHASVWELPQNRYTAPGQIYCRRLAREACRSLGLRIDPSFAK